MYDSSFFEQSWSICGLSKKQPPLYGIAFTTLLNFDGRFLTAPSRMWTHYVYSVLFVSSPFVLGASFPLVLAIIADPLVLVLWTLSSAGQTLDTAAIPTM
jgi:hypothetical protein